MNASKSNGRAKPGERFDNWPRNLSREACILGGIVIHNEVLAQLPELQVDDFFDPKHKVVFAAMRALEHAGAPIDVTRLEVEIERQGKLDAIGGLAHVGELVMRSVDPENVVLYAADLKRDARNRYAIVALSSALERAKNWPHDAAELISELAGELQRIEIDHPASTGRVVLVRDPVLTPRLADFLGEAEDEDDAMDWIIRDLVPRVEPVIWGGPMKAGKTWGVMDICLSVASGEASWLGRFENTLGGPARVLGLFLEDNKRRIDIRLSELARGRGRDLRTDPVLAEHLSISRAPIRLPSEASAFIRRVRAFAPSLIVIDNLTRIFEGDPNSTRDAANFTRAWTEIGEELCAAVMLLHHTKKPVSDREVDPFDQLRGSGDFGATARNMVVAVPLHVPSEASPAKKDLCAEVRMRGNLDLRVDSFVLGFRRGTDEQGRSWARLVDLGQVAAVKEDAKQRRKEQKAAAKSAERVAKVEHANAEALRIMNDKGACSAYDLGAALGLSNTADIVKTTMRVLESRDDVRRDARKGLVWADERRS